MSSKTKLHKHQIMTRNLVLVKWRTGIPIAVYIKVSAILLLLVSNLLIGTYQNERVCQARKIVLQMFRFIP